MTNKPLSGKRILFFAPKFFGYEVAIANKLQELGANVMQFDERPKNNFLTKALIRIDRNIIKRTITQYYKNILGQTQQQQFDFVFVVNSVGQLKGISFPETLGDEDTVDPVVEEIISYLIEKYKLVRPADATLH